MKGYEMNFSSIEAETTVAYFLWIIDYIIVENGINRYEGYEDAFLIREYGEDEVSFIIKNMTLPGDVCIDCYKHIGRGMTTNKPEFTVTQWAKLFIRVIDEIMNA
jgi:hypothetical protein